MNHDSSISRRRCSRLVSGVDVELFLRVGVDGGPAHAAAVGAQLDAVDADQGVDPEGAQDHVGQLGAVHDHADLGVDVRGAWVQVHRADEHGLAVQKTQLGVQATGRRAEQATQRVVELQACGAHLVQVHTHLQQVGLVTLQADADQRFVAGRERIGDHAYADAGGAQGLDAGERFGAGNEVRREQQHFAVRVAQRLQEAVRDRVVDGDAVVVRLGLKRRVGKGESLGGEPANAALCQRGAEGRGAEEVGAGGCGFRVVGRGVLLEAGAQRLGRCRGRAGRAHDVERGVDLQAVPVQVEPVVELRQHRAGDEQVEVDEVALCATQEVFVGKVAPAHHRDRTVGDEEFVVHAVVEPLEAARQRHEPAQRRITRGHEGVEQAHFHVRVGGQAEQQPVHVGRVQVVEQQAHTHTAQGGIAQRAQHQAAGRVVGDQVTLQVDRARGGVDHRQACVEREAGLRQRPDAAGALGQAGFAGEGDERSVGRAHQRLRRHTLDLRQHAGAAGERGDQQRADQPVQHGRVFNAIADRRCRSARSAVRSRAVWVPIALHRRPRP